MQRADSTFQAYPGNQERRKTMAAICGHAHSQEQEPVGKPTLCLINPTQGKSIDR